MKKETETKSQLQEQLEANVTLEAVGLYRHLLLSKFKCTPLADYEGRVEDSIQEIEKIVDSFKKYFLG